MNAEEIIRFIHDAKKTTPVKAYVKAKPGIEFPGCRTFGAGDCVVFGEVGRRKGGAGKKRRRH